jgi:N-acetylneuraminic acid mutarotase
MRITYALIVLAACGDDGGGGNGDASSGDGNGAAGWTTGTAVANGPIQETAAVAVAGKIYVIGGLSGQGTVARVQIYDTATGTWSDGPNLPIGMHHVNAATDGTTIYVLGGLNPSFAPLGNAYSLAPATETQWTARMSMSAGRERGAAVTDIIDGKIYLAGGLRGGQASDQVDVYDPGSDAWTPLQAMPATRDHACGATIDGKLVVAGGRTVSTSSPRPDVWSYDPDTNMWTPRAPMPTGRGGMGCGAIGGKLYTAGGEGNAAVASGVFPDVEAFDPAMNMWTELANMPNPKHGVGGAVWNGALYLCGGADQEGLGAIAATDIFKP